ncbi:MAG: helix-turn-helix domain-containing protein [Armatimonadetes bacterium]|nr:helix-turn-helix domain-containing protein [Armatimonadota bacterium]
MPVVSRWRKVREDAGLSFLDAAQRLELTKGALSMLENNKIHASRSVLERACAVYDCQPGDLYEMIEEEELAEEKVGI